MTDLNTSITEKDAPEIPKYMFGSLRMEKSYKDTISTLVDRKIFRVYHKNISDSGQVTITICNLWKLVKKPGKAKVTVLYRDLNTDTYLPCNKENPLPEMGLLPVNGYRTGEGLWFHLISQAIEVVYMHHFKNAAGTKTEGEAGWSNVLRAIKIRYVGGHPRIKKKEKFQRLNEPRYFYGSGKYRAGRLVADEYKMVTRALIKNIWIHMIDKPTLGAISSLYGFHEKITLNRYVECSHYSDHLLRIRKERPNLMPLLRNIPKKHWTRLDLFSKENWVREHGEDRKLANDFTRGLRPLRTKASLKWLFGQSYSALSKIVNSDFQNTLTIVSELMTGAKLERGLPAVIHMRLIDSAKILIKENVTASDEKKVLLLKIHAARLKGIWQNAGFSRLRKHVIRYEYEFSDLMDWLRFEGFTKGFPDKNSTWESLSRHARDWHLERRKANGRYYSWDSLLPETTVDNIKVKPLTDTGQLEDEGFHQNHCVVDYDYDCHLGNYRIFGMEDPNNIRYTLCIQVDKKLKWTVQQVRAESNENCPKEVVVAAKKIANNYSLSEKVSV
ncbi:PcfJ domain-containing protein [Pseudomonas syringae pv. actinidiae]|nr:PcfJ domain-containing protein [Pseudomonas syringae pv. actinidiae]